MPFTNRTRLTSGLRHLKILAALTAGSLTAMNPLDANAQKPLSAAESDPIKMGWMQGFPPTPDKVLKAADGSFFEFPGMRYSVVHMRQFLPTTNVSRGVEAPSPLPYALDDQIDALTFTPTNSKTAMTWRQSLDENYTDGIIILRRGKVVYERYFGALKPNEKHAAMSVTKSFTGTLASILVAEGKINPDARVTDYVPELKASAFGDATVRQVMDMTTALQFSEDYANKEAEIWEYSGAGNPLPKPENYNGPIGYFEALQNVKKHGEHGHAFGYKTPNADALGWIVSRASGESVAQLLSDKIWKRIGMEQDAYYQVDALGIPFAGGGLSAGLRDMARFGELIRNQGNWRGEQIIPAAAVEDIERGGSKNAFAKSDHPDLAGWSYRNMWWMTENAHGAFAARGVHGQTIYIDPAAEMVLVRFASHPVAGNAANDPTSLPAYAAVAQYLMQHPEDAKNGLTGTF
jgi:CubicO group peptidase (beta-lactamase class C family)